MAAVFTLTGVDNLSPAATTAEASLTKLEATGTRIGSALTAAFGAAAVAGVVGLGAALASTVTTAADFEKQISAISAVAGPGTASIDQLRATALQLGKDTSFSASEAAAGMEEMVKAGLSIADVMNGGARAALDLAAAGGLSVAEAATVASNAMNAFGLAGSDMAHIADSLAGASVASATDVHQLGFALASVGAVAHTVGLSFDDTTTAISLLAQAGLKGSDAGTSLKSMLLSLSPSTKPAIAEMKTLGIITAEGANQFFDATGKVKSMSEIAGVLQKSMQGLTKEQQLNALQTIFGTDAIRAAAIMAEAGAEGFDKMTAAEAAAGGAQAIANERLNNFMGSMEKLRGSLETGAIMIGSLFLPALKGIADQVTDVVNSILPMLEEIPDAWRTIGQVFKNDWSPSETLSPFMNMVGTTAIKVKSLVDVVVGLPEPVKTAGLAFAAVMVAAGPLSTVLSALPVLFGLLAAPIAALLSPLGLVALGVAALAAAWTSNLGGIQEKTQALLDIVGPAFEQLGSIISTALSGDVAGAFSSFLTLVGGVAEQLAPLLATWGQEFVDWIGPATETMLAALVTLGTAVVEWIATNGPVILATLAAWGAAFVEWIAPMIPPALIALGDLIVQIGTWVVAQVPVITAQLAAWGQAFVDWVAPMIPLALAAMAPFLAAIVDWTVTTALPALGTAFTTMLSNAITLAGSAASAIAAAFTALTAWLAAVDWTALGTSTGTLLATMLAEAINLAVAAGPVIAAGLTAITAWFTSLEWTTIGESVGTLLATMIGGAIMLAIAAGEAISAAQTAFTQWITNVNWADVTTAVGALLASMLAAAIAIETIWTQFSAGVIAGFVQTFTGLSVAEAAAALQTKISEMVMGAWNAFIASWTPTLPIPSITMPGGGGAAGQPGVPGVPLSNRTGSHASPYIPLINQISAEMGEDPALVAALMETEGSGAASVSPAGAAGLMQVVPGQGFNLPGENAADPATSIRQGIRAIQAKRQALGPGATPTDIAGAYFGYGTDAGGMTTGGYRQRFQNFYNQYQPSPGQMQKTPLGPNPLGDAGLMASRWTPADMQGVIDMVPPWERAMSDVQTSSETAFQGVLTSSTDMGNGATLTITQLGTTATATMTDAAGNITGQWTSMTDGVQAATDTLATEVPVATATMSEQALVSVTDLGDGMTLTVQNMGDQTVATITDMAGNVTSQYTTMAGAVTTATTDMVTDSTAPLLEFTGQGGSLFQTMSTEVSGAAATMDTNVTGSVEGMATAVGTTVGNMVGAAVTLADGMDSGVSGSFASMGADSTTATVTMATDVGGTVGNLVGAVVTLADGMNTGVSASADTMGQAVSGAVGEMAGGVGTDVSNMVSSTVELADGMNTSVVGSADTMNTDTTAAASDMSTNVGDALGALTQPIEDTGAGFIAVGSAADEATGPTDTFAGSVDATGSAADTATQPVQDFSEAIGSVEAPDLHGVASDITAIQRAAQGAAKEVGKLGSILDELGSEAGKSLGKKASGGPVYHDSMYMVGEQGPELFVPSQSGWIVPNHRLRGLAAGGFVSVSGGGPDPVITALDTLETAVTTGTEAIVTALGEPSQAVLHGQTSPIQVAVVPTGPSHGQTVVSGARGTGNEQIAPPVSAPAAVAAPVAPAALPGPNLAPPPGQKPTGPLPPGWEWVQVSPGIWSASPTGPAMHAVITPPPPKPPTYVPPPGGPFDQTEPGHGNIGPRPIEVTPNLLHPAPRLGEPPMLLHPVIPPSPAGPSIGGGGNPLLGQPPGPIISGGGNSPDVMSTRSIAAATTMAVKVGAAVTAMQATSTTQAKTMATHVTGSSDLMRDDVTTNVTDLSTSSLKSITDLADDSVTAAGLMQDGVVHAAQLMNQGASSAADLMRTGVLGSAEAMANEVAGDSGPVSAMRSRAIDIVDNMRLSALSLVGGPQASSMRVGLKSSVDELNDALNTAPRGALYDTQKRALDHLDTLRNTGIDLIGGSRADSLRVGIKTNVDVLHEGLVGPDGAFVSIYSKSVTALDNLRNEGISLAYRAANGDDGTSGISGAFGDVEDSAADAAGPDGVGAIKPELVTLSAFKPNFDKTINELKAIEKAAKDAATAIKNIPASAGSGGGGGKDSVMSFGAQSSVDEARLSRMIASELAKTLASQRVAHPLNFSLTVEPRTQEYEIVAAQAESAI
jgi:TP901 family phage tail tape measure protein